MKEVEEYENENMIRTKVSKREIKKLKKKDAADDNIFTSTNEFANLNNILSEKMKEEVTQHKKFEETKNTLKDQMKNYLGKKVQASSHGGKDNY